MSYRRLVLILVALLLSACDDLNPSANDNRAVVEAGTSGPNVGQIAPDFALFDSHANPVSMVTELASADAIVLYFTMWCPVCDSHMSHMRAEIIPQFPAVKFYFVDYVSGAIDIALAAQQANGYASSTVLVDESQYVLDLYQATMATTVVIDAAGVVQMNEDYKDGSRLLEVLSALPVMP